MLCTTLIVMISSGVIIYYTANQRSSTALLAAYDLFSDQVSTNMADSITSILQSMRDASLMVDVFQPRSSVCGAPPANHTGEVLLRSLVALPDGASGNDTWLSLGLMQRASQNSSDKLSWQMALGFGCPAHIYAYIDQYTTPAFLGYCAKLTPDYEFELSSEVTYNGTDWGFTPLERAMLFEEAYDEAFVPVKPLLGVLEFSYRRLVRCDNKPYALVFVSRSVTQLDLALDAQRSSDKEVAFVVERDTGLLVFASVANQTSVDGARVKATNATNPLIRQAATFLKTPVRSLDDKIYVSVTPFAPARGVDWLLVVAADATTVTQPLEEDAATTRTIVIVTGVVTVLAVGLMTFLLVTLPIRRMVKTRDERATPRWWKPKEINDVQSLLHD
jgi:hypothetical protein